MTRTYSSRARDQQLADGFGADSELMCQANGCPNRWSVDFGKGRLCHWHDIAPHSLWPQVTQDQVHAETQRVIERQRPQPAPAPVDREAARRRLRAFRIGGEASKSWAYALKTREESGDRLTQAQRDAWRGAIKHEPEEQ